MKISKSLIIVFLSLIFSILASVFAFASESKLEVHFLDVGQGDCAILTCDGKSAMIDGGNADKSQLVYTYLKNQGITELEYMFCTHPDADHSGGLSGALNRVTVGKAFCSTTTHDSEAFKDLTKYLNKQGVKLNIPTAGDMYKLGSADIKVLSVGKNGENNNDSIVLRVDHGKNSFLFMGDAEQEIEQVLLKDNKKFLDCDVLKVSHHGSNDASTKEFLNAVSPSYAIISVGKNNYGHPSEEVLDSLKKTKAEIHRTDYNGHIKIISDGKTIDVSDSKDTQWNVVVAGKEKLTQKSLNKIDSEIADTSSEVSYILNSNSKKIHKPGCKSVKKMKESNKVYFTGTKEEAVSQGYEPCKNCNP